MKYGNFLKVCLVSLFFTGVFSLKTFGSTGQNFELVKKYINDGHRFVFMVNSENKEVCFEVTYDDYLKLKVGDTFDSSSLDALQENFKEHSKKVSSENEAVIDKVSENVKSTEKLLDSYTFFIYGVIILFGILLCGSRLYLRKV